MARDRISLSRSLRRLCSLSSFQRWLLTDIISYRENRIGWRDGAAPRSMTQMSTALPVSNIPTQRKLPRSESLPQRLRLGRSDLSPAQGYYSACLGAAIQHQPHRRLKSIHRMPMAYGRLVTPLVTSGFPDSSYSAQLPMQFIE